MRIINEIKINYLRKLAKTNSFTSAWKIWQPEIAKRLSPKPTGQEIFDLGDSLSDIFQSNVQQGRSQGSLSGGGAAWECLISWYLNFVCWNTPVLIIRQNRSFVPSVINDVLAVTISNNKTNTEADIVIFSVPEDFLLENSDLKTLNDHIKTRLDKILLVNLQCKTNWNDNAQIPMLWDMIYNSDSRLPNISVGNNGVSPRSVEQFRYGFVTVPTVKLESFKPSTLSVLRVKNMTGGNYWGHPSRSDIASNIKDLPSRNFSRYFNGGISSHLDRSIDNDSKFLEDFLNLTW